MVRWLRALIALQRARVLLLALTLSGWLTPRLSHSVNALNKKKKSCWAVFNPSSREGETGGSL